MGRIHEAFLFAGVLLWLKSLKDPQRLLLVIQKDSHMLLNQGRIEGFQRSIWAVFTGRKDGRVSMASEATSNLPSASANFTTLLQQFEDNGLDLIDLRWTLEALLRDGHYYHALNKNMGILRSDAALLTDPQSAQIAQALQHD
ncbi:Peroxidase [Forsythia ovata]|uniref:peroxidase n=1 Tax=Forsythia ovata TaxID=205694 RepID=A0ABD1PJC8_9LAMI